MAQHLPAGALLVVKSETVFGQPDESLRKTFAFLGLQPKSQ
jgi:hypothetical protein